MKTIEHWTIKVTWSDGKEEFLDHIPYCAVIDNYLDELEKEENEETEEEEEEEDEDDDL